MPHRFAFLRPTMLFSILRESAGDDVRVIFRRFQRSGQEASLHVAHLGDGADERYLSGGYSELYLTLGKLPESPTDWGFTDRTADELIFVTGCRTRDNILEVCTLRPFAKVSRAQALFERIDHRLKKSCKKGLVADDGMAHPDIWIEPEVMGMELRQNLDQQGSAYRVPRNGPSG